MWLLNLDESDLSIDFLFKYTGNVQTHFCRIFWKAGVYSLCKTFYVSIWALLLLQFCSVCCTWTVFVIFLNTDANVLYVCADVHSLRCATFLGHDTVFNTHSLTFFHGSEVANWNTRRFFIRCAGRTAQLKWRCVPFVFDKRHRGIYQINTRTY